VLSPRGKKRGARPTCSAEKEKKGEKNGRREAGRFRHASLKKEPRSWRTREERYPVVPCLLLGERGGDPRNPPFVNQTTLTR